MSEHLLRNTKVCCLPNGTSKGWHGAIIYTIKRGDITMWYVKGNIVLFMKEDKISFGACT